MARDRSKWFDKLPMTMTRETMSDPSPVSREDTPVWGEPSENEYAVTLRAACHCWVVVSVGIKFDSFTGAHCPAHTFAHLVSGERLLREAQQKGNQG